MEGGLDGSKTGGGKPVDAIHPMIARLREVVLQRDPGRRFLPTSASSPREHGSEKDFGKGLHWDVHGPWKVRGDLATDWVRYWENDDALFRSEVGAPGASPAEIIRRYKEDCEELPATAQNPLWQIVGWWVEWDKFRNEKGRGPLNLKECVDWSQEHQARGRFPSRRSHAKGASPAAAGFSSGWGMTAFPARRTWL